jgi:hypothetical protein
VTYLVAEVTVIKRDAASASPSSKCRAKRAAANDARSQCDGHMSCIVDAIGMSLAVRPELSFCSCMCAHAIPLEFRA